MISAEFIGSPFPRCAAILLGTLLLQGCPGGNGDGTATSESPEPIRETTVAQWPVFRGDPRLRGRSPGDATHPPRMVWRVNLGQDVASTPVIAEDRVFVACEDGLVFALNASDGTGIWHFDNGFGFEASPLFHDGKIYIGSLDGIMYCLDADSGELVWKENREGKISGSANFIEVTKGDSTLPLLIFGSYDNQLHALDARTGEAVWSYPTDNYINGSPAITASGAILFGGCDAYAHVVDATTGESIRRVFLNTYIPASIALDGNKGYSGNYDGELFAFEVDTGEILWTFMTSGAPISSVPAVGRDHIIASSEDRRLYAVDKSTGEEVWNHNTGRTLESGPLIVGETVIAADTLGEIHAVRLSDGSILWTYDLGAPMTAAPAIASDRLFIGDQDGWMHALTLDPTEEQVLDKQPVPDQEKKASPFVSEPSDATD